MYVTQTAVNVAYQYRCKVTDVNGNVVYSEPGIIRTPQIRWVYTYNADGIRRSRTDNVTTYQYVYNGDKLSYMSVDGQEMYFTYDAGGSPMAVNYNGTDYYYATNLQGDVVALLDTSGTAVVTYTYDAWGKPLSCTGSMADTLGVYNPLRYRGYVYDEETGQYYLQSRYYDPEIGRFINADAFTATGQGIHGNNMFAYCNNNPILYIDSSGSVPLVGRPHTVLVNDGAKTSVTRVFINTVKKAYNYLTNTDPDEALDSSSVAFYNGTPVIELPFMGQSAFSYGVIFVGPGVTGTNTLKHEYGHKIHYDLIGPTRYLKNVGIYSILGFIVCGENGKDIYYSLPWEYVADKLGNVNRSPYD
jgi:RHS repeat-associated protein